MVYSDARYCAGRDHRDNPLHGRLLPNRAGADAEIRSTGGRIARYSQMADPPCRPQGLSRQEADLNAANAAAPEGVRRRSAEYKLLGRQACCSQVPPK